MKRILFLFSLLPYLASAQVAKDTVTVLTPAQITAASPNDTANIYFVIANAWRKANFDSIARYTRNRFQTLTLDSTHIAANGLNLQGTRFTGVLPVARGGTGSETQNFVDLTTTQSIGGVKTFTSELTATRFNPTANTATGTGMFLPAANTLAFSTNGTEKVQITSAGNVGIGMTSITAKLDVNGNINFKNNLSGEITSSGAQIVFYNNANQAFWINMNNNNNTGRFICGVEGPANTTFAGSSANSAFFGSNAGDLHILSNGSIQQTIKSNGNIGIGTATPDVQFHTTGGVRFAGLANITDLRTDADGDLFNGSDFNLKNSIEPIGFGINDIMKLRPVEFYWNKESRNSSLYKNLGFIAQDVMDAIPNAASIMGDGDLQIDYNALVATLTKAIQEQQQQIEALKTRITQLENK